MSAGDQLDNLRGMTGTQYTNAPVRVSVSAATATSALLPPGEYLFHSDAECFVRQGTSAVTAAVSDNRLVADTYMWLVVTSAADGYIAAITASGTATLELLKV